MAAATEQDSCSMCIEKFTKQPHKKQAKCPYCDVKACVTCTQTYLLGTHEDAHCMGCRRGWSREALDQILLTTWINGAYKLHRQNVLLDRERSRLPAAQIHFENVKKGVALVPQLLVIQKEAADVQAQLYHLQLEYSRMNHRISLLKQGIDPDQNGTTTKEDREKRAFVMPCPATGCRGFLSSAYKCGVCDIYCCADCHEIKGINRDADHTCDANTVATVRAIKKECRNCPDCGTNIFKIEGCFAKDTLIPLWDGTFKPSQSIQVGDELIGDDGQKRTVKSVVSGEDDLYEVIQQKGESYTVNSKHTLALKYSGDKSIHYNKNTETWKINWFDRTEYRPRSKMFTTLEEAEKYCNTALTFDDVIEIKVDDYMKLDKWSKMYLMGYKSNIGINYTEQSVKLDPYMLGLWLGDGTSSLPDIASNDIEIQKYIIDWCNNNNCELIHDEGVKFRIRRTNGTNYKDEMRNAIGYGSSCDSCTGCKSRRMDICDSVFDKNNQTFTMNTKTNPFTYLLKQYKLVNNKHIPKEYLMNSREVRLKVLAGLIDTDGYIPKYEQGKRAIIVQIEGQLVKDIIFLCRSLGFVVNVTRTERKNIKIFNYEAKDYKDVYKINISGNHLHEIPTLLPRKKCESFNPNKDNYRTHITVTRKDRGTYYGWSVDSNHRFLYNDFTVVRNCDQMYCTNCNTAFSWKTGHKVTNGVIHNPHYYEYLRATNGGVMPRNPGDIPCAGNLPNAWTFDREVQRRFPNLSATTTGWLYSALNNIAHIHHVEIPAVTNRAEDTNNNDLNVRYISKDITETRWKQLLAQREKRRLKRDEIRQRYEAFIGACTDIYGRIMNIARDGAPAEERNMMLRGNTPLTNQTKEKREAMAKACKESVEQLQTLRKIFNDSLMDISKRYKCQVLQLSETGLKRETKKYEAGRTPRRVKKSDGDTVASSSTNDFGDTDDEVEIVEQNTLVRQAAPPAVPNR